MKKKKSYSFRSKQQGIKISLHVFGTLIMFYALYFGDKTTSWTTISENSENPKMYYCLLTSFVGSYFINRIAQKLSKKKDNR
jgi:hypothetical protein